MVTRVFMELRKLLKSQQNVIKFFRAPPQRRFWLLLRRLWVWRSNVRRPSQPSTPKRRSPKLTTKRNRNTSVTDRSSFQVSFLSCWKFAHLINCTNTKSGIILNVVNLVNVVVVSVRSQFSDQKIVKNWIKSKCVFNY